MQVTGLFIYPVKSCAEQSLASAEVTPRGFAGDRIFQVTHADEQRYLTPRESGCQVAPVPSISWPPTVVGGMAAC